MPTDTMIPSCTLMLSQFTRLSETRKSSDTEDSVEQRIAQYDERLTRCSNGPEPRIDHPGHEVQNEHTDQAQKPSLVETVYDGRLAFQLGNDVRL